MSSEDVLKHYGVLGMRKPRTGAAAKSNDLSQVEEGILKKVFPNGVDANAMQAKYGPGSMDGKPAKERRQLTPDQKRRLVKAGVVVGVGVGLYALGNKAQYAHLPKNTRGFFKDQSKFLKGRKLEDYADIRDVFLEPGSILSRISATEESSIRENGFYAAFGKDVDRYKAVIPVFWKIWGMPNTEGHVVNISANKGVKAASPKNANEIFKKWSADRGGWPGAGTDEGFFQFAHIWAAHGAESNADIKSFFDEVKKAGYNALVDVNDAGALGKTPLRMLDNDGFSIDSVQKLTAPNIRGAQRKLKDLKIQHEELEMAMNDILAHYGVKGMKWGVRRTREQLRAAGKQAKAAAQNRADAEAAKTRTTWKKGLEDAPVNLTDDELKRRISRMENEKKYLELNQKTVSSGEKLVAEIITDSGKKVAKNAVAGALTLAVGTTVGAKFGPKAADVIQRGGVKKK